MNRQRFVSYMRQKFLSARFDFFLKLLTDLERPIKVLDVGGTIIHWQKIDFSSLGDIEVRLLNILPQQEVEAPFFSVVGDGRDLSRYADQEFDLVYSNSVINMVDNFADQKQMAQEIRRVGKRYFVQTPNHRFWLDWRTMVPFFHF